MEKKKMASFRLSKAAVAAGVTLGLSAIGAPLALAHDAVIGGAPADNETVQEFPDTLTIDFSGEVQQGFNTLTLSHAESDEVVFSGEPDVEGTEVSLTLPEDFEATPGAYRIGYQIVSSDGHPTKGVTNFTYEPAGAASSTATVEEAQNTGENANEVETADEASDESFNMTWLWAVAGILAIGGVAAVAFARMKKTPPESHPENRPDSPSTPTK